MMVGAYLEHFKQEIIEFNFTLLLRARYDPVVACSGCSTGEIYSNVLIALGSVLQYI